MVRNHVLCSIAFFEGRLGVEKLPTTNSQSDDEKIQCGKKCKSPQ